MSIRKLLIAVALAAVCLVAGRGLFRATPLAGHDAAAYPITLHQFHQNLRDGVLFPRWAPDMRYGYGHAQLQFRPPALHYLAEPWYALTGNPFAGLHAALLILIGLAGTGLYALARNHVRPPYAIAAAAAYVTFNYFLANLYLRGAYYEVAAYAFMPWILWAQTRMFAGSGGGGGKAAVPLWVGALAWVGLLCGHPATAFFFFPLAVAHGLVLWHTTRRHGAALRVLLAFVAGALLAAPYVYVMVAEERWVRMAVFYNGLESYAQHFISVKNLLLERCPREYIDYDHLDSLGRLRYREMRGFNGWALVVLAAVVAFGFVRRPDAAAWRRWVAFYSVGVLASVAMCLPFSRGLWEAIGVMQTFNFPWRSLSVSGLCVAMLTGLALQWLDRPSDILLTGSVSSPHDPGRDASPRRPRTAGTAVPTIEDHVGTIMRRSVSACSSRPVTATAPACAVTADEADRLSRGKEDASRGIGRRTALVLAALLIGWCAADAYPHTRGWAGPAWLTRDEVTSPAIRRHQGIPEQYYTPTWVRRYAEAPAPEDAFLVAGTGQVHLVERRATRWRLQVSAAHPVTVALAHYYYPGWRVHGLSGASVDARAWSDRGLIAFEVPAGQHDIEVRFDLTRGRRLGYGLALLGLALLVATPLVRAQRRMASA